MSNPIGNIRYFNIKLNYHRLSYEAQIRCRKRVAQIGADLGSLLYYKRKRTEDLKKRLLTTAGGTKFTHWAQLYLLDKTTLSYSHSHGSREGNGM